MKTNESKRQPGYYWVKVLSKWVIEEWDGKKWIDHGCQDGNDYYVSFFEEIDERRVAREEFSISKELEQNNT